ncbi:hypothetical protein N9H39_06560 [Gammaproteobacteria bacterium]|nr:hypothetical protein [Gammaproteobacteria bacterium]
MLQRLLSRWVFKIDIETCEQCGGAVKVIASIEDPVVINDNYNSRFYLTAKRKSRGLAPELDSAQWIFPL